MYTIDVNCDLGESFGNYKCGMDEEVLPYISSANVACGFHASDPLIMAKTVQMAKQQGVSIGAHPGYPDLVGFGRRNMNVNTQELKAMVQYLLCLFLCMFLSKKNAYRAYLLPTTMSFFAFDVRVAPSEVSLTR